MKRASENEKKKIESCFEFRFLSLDRAPLECVTEEVGDVKALKSAIDHYF